jgi:hypothetical protein
MVSGLPCSDNVARDLQPFSIDPGTLLNLHEYSLFSEGTGTHAEFTDDMQSKLILSKPSKSALHKCIQKGKAKHLFLSRSKERSCCK